MHCKASVNISSCEELSQIKPSVTLGEYWRQIITATGNRLWPLEAGMESLNE